MKKTCPIMSVTVAAKAQNIRDIPVAWKGIPCLEDSCALWVPELKCCSHRVDTTRLMTEVQKLKESVAGVNIPAGMEALAEVDRESELRECMVEDLVEPNEKGEHRHIIAGPGMFRLGERILVIRMKSKAGGQGGAAHPDPDPSSSSPSSED